ncbi:hypothetical protein D3C78_1562050 [compost metagenome]
MLFNVDQIRRQRIGLLRVNPQHDANGHAASALQHHISGSQRGDPGDTMQVFHGRGWQLFRVDGALFTGDKRLRHEPQDVVFEIFLEAIHH